VAATDKQWKLERKPERWGSKDDEAEEYARQERERAKLSPIERLHGGPTRKTVSGLPDLRSLPPDRQRRAAGNARAPQDQGDGHGADGPRRS